MKKALITGITGQDGSYLAEFLVSKGYEVHGIQRRTSVSNTGLIDHINFNTHPSNPNLYLHYGDLADSSHLTNLIYNIEPDEIYNLAAQSQVRVSFDMPEYSSDITGLGTLRLLESIRRSGLNCKFYQASTSEMFGSSTPPQNEDSHFHPRSPYACAKLMSYWTVVNYRDGYDLFAVNGILFNHESPRRGDVFVTRKITNAVAKIRAGKQDKLFLGNLDPQRDWGYAPEYVEIMWKMMQYEEPQDFVIGTGETHSVKEFLEEAFEYVGLDSNDYVQTDSKVYRPTEVNSLKADTTKASTKLGWEPKITFSDLVKIMIDADLRAIGEESIGEGDGILDEKFPDRWWNID